MRIHSRALIDDSIAKNATSVRRISRPSYDPFLMKIIPAISFKLFSTIMFALMGAQARYLEGAYPAGEGHLPEVATTSLAGPSSPLPLP